MAACEPRSLEDTFVRDLRAGKIIQIKEGTKVQVMERSVEWKMLKLNCLMEPRRIG
jgi:hypothetical protein